MASPEANIAARIFSLVRKSLNKAQYKFPLKMELFSGISFSRLGDIEKKLYSTPYKDGETGFCF